MNVIKVKLRLCESSVKSLKTLLFDVTLSGTNILRDVVHVSGRALEQCYLSLNSLMKVKVVMLKDQTEKTQSCLVYMGILAIGPFN